MRHFPKDKYDRSEAKRLGAKPWMLNALKLNPEYVYWGPYEDYMAKRGKNEGPDDFGREEDHGWESRVFIESWLDFDWSLDELNECVNYYFCIERTSRDCQDCGGSGVHPHALWVYDSWYKHKSPFRTPTSSELAMNLKVQLLLGNKKDSSPLSELIFPSKEVLNLYSPEFRSFCEKMRDGDGYWNDKLTQDEVDALIEAGRLRDFTHKWSRKNGFVPKTNPIVTADEVNAWQRKGGSGHDAINMWIACEQRFKRLGLPEKCPACNGYGNIFTEPDSHLALVLWMILPRKGASRGVHIKHIDECQLKEVSKWLLEAKKRNNERFAKISEFAINEK